VLCLFELDEAGDGLVACRADLIPFACTPAVCTRLVVAVLFRSRPTWSVAGLLLPLRGDRVSMCWSRPRWTDMQPQSWARTPEGQAQRDPGRRVCCGWTDCGAEVLAHTGAITGSAMAANCIASRAAPVFGRPALSCNARRYPVRRWLGCS